MHRVRKEYYFFIFLVASVLILPACLSTSNHNPMKRKPALQPADVATVASETQTQAEESKCTLIELLREAKAAVARFRKALSEATEEEKAQFDRELEADRQGRRVF